MRAEVALYTAYEELTLADPAEPERNLMRAILRSAMEDMKKRGEPYRDARRYFMNNDDSYLYSFTSICNHLNICPRTVRASIGLVGTEREERIAA